MASDYWSILFNLVRYRKISFLSPEETKVLIQQPVQDYITYDELAVDMIAKTTAGHPYFTQLICHELVAPLVGKEMDYITSSHAAKAIAKVAREGCPHLEYIWKESTPTERTFLYGLNQVLRRKGEAMADSVRDYLLEAGIRYEEEGTTDSLVARELVQRDGHRYRFTIGLVQEWVNRTKGPGDIFKERS
jgi:hypothetical protein